MNQVEYHDLRADQAEAARAGGSSLYHQCQNCGRCEIAGGWCSSCTHAEYDLLAHLHEPQRSNQSTCPLTRLLDYGTAVQRGVYHHRPGASVRRFGVARRSPSEAQLAVLATARQARS